MNAKTIKSLAKKKLSKVGKLKKGADAPYGSKLPGTANAPQADKSVPGAEDPTVVVVDGAANTDMPPAASAPGLYSSTFAGRSRPVPVRGPLPRSDPRTGAGFNPAQRIPRHAPGIRPR